MKDTKIEKSRLAQFCDTIIMQAREALYDREDDILKAWHENIEEAQQNDKKFPPLKLGISATVDLEESKIETTLRFTAVYQSRIEAEIADPDQQELPGLGKALKGYVKAVLDENDRKLEELNEFAQLRGILKEEGEEEDVMIHDADEGPEIREVEEEEEPAPGWCEKSLKECLSDLLDTLPIDETFEFLELVFADGTAEPFLKAILDDKRPSALMKQMACRAAIRGDTTNLLRDALVCEGAKAAMRKLEKTGSAKAITAAAKDLVALLVPKDLAELDLLLEGGSVLPLGVRNMIRKATDKALADMELGETQSEGSTDDYRPN